MTPEEQVRMNELCVAIQEEKNYERFAAMLHEMSELIARKKQRRFPDQPKIVWVRLVIPKGGWRFRFHGRMTCFGKYE
jgi:hypothetical protein